MKTIFVSRLDYATGEPELRAEFARHGNIRSIALVKDKEGKSRGYAFIEYEHTGDMKAAYKAYPPEGFMKVGKSERWSLVDVERGRTVPDWCALVSWTKTLGPSSWLWPSSQVFRFLFVSHAGRLRAIR